MAAEKPTFKGIDAPRGEADDLKRLPGVNVKLEQRLNDVGVYHFWQIADLDAETMEALDSHAQPQRAHRARQLDCRRQAADRRAGGLKGDGEWRVAQ